MTDIQTIVSHYITSLDDPKVLAELKDILANHFWTMKHSDFAIDNEYFNIELQLANKNKE